MIGRTESTRLSYRVLARVTGLLTLLAVLCFAPAALAFTPTPSGQFGGDMGSNDEAVQRNRQMASGVLHQHLPSGCDLRAGRPP